jgi:hypothetical protein
VPESLIALSEGSGAKNAHTFQLVIGSSTVEDDIVRLADQYLASYYVPSAAGISAATAASHLLQLMAGGTLNLYLRRVLLYQVGMATTASATDMILTRLSSAGTGGTAATPSPMDSTDAAAGATAQTLPTAKGTETTNFWRGQVYFNQTLPTFAAGPAPLLILDLDFDKMPRFKMPRILAGTSNGVALKIISGIAAATVSALFLFTEQNF